MKQYVGLKVDFRDCRNADKIKRHCDLVSAKKHTLIDFETLKKMTLS